MKVRNFRFNKMRGISCPAEELLASQEGLCSLELVSYIIASFSETYLVMESFWD
jgi:hypothetical protein